MDYIFRWLQLRFLTDKQQTLFDDLRPKHFGAPPVGAPEQGGQKSFGDFVESSPVASSGLSSSGLSSRAERSGVEASAVSLSSRGEAEGSALSSQHYEPSLHHRGGAIHAADALKDLIDLGDAPTCSTCGAIMTRNGSCYRCMSCGSTSGCS
jgi:ribonucleoside-diphosphate reductase alpha chain